jgi:hypothetical protein
MAISLFPHVFPLNPSREKLNKGLEPPIRVYLAIAEIFYYSVKEQFKEISPFRISPKAHFFKENAHSG